MLAAEEILAKEKQLLAEEAAVLRQIEREAHPDNAVVDAAKAPASAALSVPAVIRAGHLTPSADAAVAGVATSAAHDDEGWGSPGWHNPAGTTTGRTTAA